MFVLCLAPPAYGILGVRRIGARRGMGIKIISKPKLFYGTMEMETSQFWRSE